MDEKLYELLMKMPKKNLINIMWDALDVMQAYNGRTKMFCIMESIGAVAHEDEYGSITFSIPKINEIKKLTSFSY